jgi:hypothetical protein
MLLMLRNILVSAKWAPIHIVNIAISTAQMIFQEDNDEELTRTDLAKKNVFEINTVNIRRTNEHLHVCQNRRPISWDPSGFLHPDGERTARGQRPMGSDTYRCRELLPCSRK